MKLQRHICTRLGPPQHRFLLHLYWTSNILPPHLKVRHPFVIDAHFNARRHPPRWVQRPTLAPCSSKGRRQAANVCHRQLAVADRPTNAAVQVQLCWALFHESSCLRAAGAFQADVAEGCANAKEQGSVTNCFLTIELIGLPDKRVFQADVAEGSTCQLAPERAGPATSHLSHTGKSRAALIKQGPGE